MLHWLSGLTITPHFDELLDHINSMFPSGPMPVAISGSVQTGETLSADDLAGHLVTACLSSFQVLRSIQGRTVSEDPLLHYTYRNSEFSYPPSGAGLFNALSAYTYALQFQLSFLYRQCSTGITTCGWWLCNFGRSVPAHNASHICPLKCQNGGNTGCRHDGKIPSNNCNHNDRSKGCGKGSNPSPLQAFLTDNLKGFCLKHPGSSNHLDNHPPGKMCHIKMGFNAESLRSSGKGVFIFTALKDFCGSSTSPLPQLCGKLGCLTKRTPRTLGDIFGFYLQLIDQLFSNRMNLETLVNSILAYLKLSNQHLQIPSDRISLFNSIYDKIGDLRSASQSNLSGHGKSLLQLYDDLPFWFQLFMVDGSKELPINLFDLRQHCHESSNNHSSRPASPSNTTHKCSTNPADLWSLYYPGCTGSDCGKYLSPLCHSIGSTFTPKFAVTYISWVLYLGDDLQSGFQKMLDEFQSVECTKDMGCERLCSHSGGQHGSMGINACSCQSVVQCGSVLPLLYRHGFQFMDARDLKDNTKSCAMFSTQLSNVLSEGAPLHNLLLAIDEFLYYVRFRFMSMVSSFWLCSFLILAYFICYGIDVLHFKSHVHFPSSHSIPPLALLTTGKARALTNLTYDRP